MSIERRLHSILGSKDAAREHKRYAFAAGFCAMLLAMFSAFTEFIAITEFAGHWFVGIIVAVVIEFMCYATFNAVGAILRSGIDVADGGRAKREMIFTVAAGVVFICFSFYWSYEGILQQRNGRTEFAEIEGTKGIVEVKQRYKQIEADIRAKYDGSEAKNLQLQIAQLTEKMQNEKDWGSKRAIQKSIDGINKRLAALSPTTLSVGMADELKDIRAQENAEIALLAEADKIAKEENKQKQLKNEQSSWLLNLMLSVFIILCNGIVGYFGAPKGMPMSTKPSERTILDQARRTITEMKASGHTASQAQIARMVSEALKYNVSQQKISEIMKQLENK